MSAGLWFIVGAVVVTFGLFVGGAVRVALASRSLLQRVGSMTTLDIDLDKTQAAIARIQRDLTKMTELFVRAQEALHAIDSEVRAMLRAFSGG